MFECVDCDATVEATSATCGCHVCDDCLEEHICEGALDDSGDED